MRRKGWISGLQKITILDRILLDCSRQRISGRDYVEGVHASSCVVQPPKYLRVSKDYLPSYWKANPCYCVRRRGRIMVRLSDRC